MLNPDNTTAHADPGSPSGEPAFGGASQVSDQPLTSGVESPTSVIDVPTAAPVGGGGAGQGGEESPGQPGETAPAGAAAVPTAAAGIAAILGVGAILINA